MRPVALIAIFSLALTFLLLTSKPFANDKDPDELVRVELSTVGIDRQSGAPVALLRDSDSGEVVPIFIGVVEAQAILHGLHEVQAPRPMTHDLLKSTIESLNAELITLQVHDIRNGTYYGRLKLRLDGQDELIEVDTRPSDGLALAVRTGASIEVSRKILRADLDFEFESPEGGDDVVRAAGITVVPATGALREELGLPERAGVLVSQVEGPPQERGIQAGDLITRVNDEEIAAPLDFLDALRHADIDEKVTITLWRDGETLEIEIPTDVPTRDETERERI